MLIDEIKTSLRIGKSNISFDDDEIVPLIDAARHELMISGIIPGKVLKDISASKIDGKELDPLVKRAITVYVKANFGWDNPEADRFQASFESLKNHLSLSAEYTGEVS